ncbi:MAG: hypothetical protein EOO91_17695 [Pedobacter sp.]|nr:MAG: hypothetical protein EOO91_17695 [Pedobacter sp.]
MLTFCAFTLRIPEESGQAVILPRSRVTLQLGLFGKNSTKIGSLLDADTLLLNLTEATAPNYQ